MVGYLPSNLPWAASLLDGDLVVVIQNNQFKQTTIASLRAAADAANQAAQADFEDLAADVNTTNKFGGRLIYDTTSGTYVYSTGSDPDDEWVYLHTAATAYTPV